MKINYIYGVLFMFVLFSLAGIPPFFGFFGKVFIILALIDEMTFFLALILILFSIVSGIYCIRIIRFLFFVDQDKYPVYFQKVRVTNGFIFFTITFTILLVYIFFFQGIIYYMFFNECELYLFDLIMIYECFKI